MQEAHNYFKDTTGTGSIGQWQAQHWFSGDVRFASLHDGALSDRQLLHIMEQMAATDSICPYFLSHGMLPFNETFHMPACKKNA